VLKRLQISEDFCGVSVSFIRKNMGPEATSHKPWATSVPGQQKPFSSLKGVTLPVGQAAARPGLSNIASLSGC